MQPVPVPKGISCINGEVVGVEKHIAAKTYERFPVWKTDQIRGMKSAGSISVQH